MRKSTLGTLTLLWMASACGSVSFEGDSNGGSSGNPSTGGTTSGDGGGSGATTASSGGQGGDQTGGSGGVQSGGTGADQTGGSGGVQSGGAGGGQTADSGGAVSDGTTGGQTGGVSGSGGKSTGTGGGLTGGTTTTTNTGGTQAGGAAGGGQSGGAAGSLIPSTVLVTSSSSGYWKVGSWTEVTSGTPTVTVNDATTNQKWEGFGGAFNEKGWSVLLSTPAADQILALRYLFSATEGANFTWGRIPIGASDYAMDRYTLDDTGTDVTPNSDESNRPPADASLSQFSLDRDGQKLIPYIQAAQKIKPDIRFWASPWTPPVWMKTGYMKVSGADRSGGTAKKPSYFDGGNMKSDAATLQAYAQYYTNFVKGYKDKGINIEIVSPQNEPGYDQNYPSCLWDKATYTTWIAKYLGPAMQTLGVKVMLGTLSNSDSGKDIDTANAALADATAKSFLAMVGAQWGVLDKVNSGTTTFGGLPIWASEHKCGNYPWCTSAGSGCPAAYNSSKAPNDLAYAQESWGYIRDAITKGKVQSYNAWNMVLDSNGLGIDTTRDWKQNALLVGASPTPAYYVFRHLSQYVVPGGSVVSTSGGDAVAFKNQDGSLVAVMYNRDSASTYTVKIGGKLLQFSMPGTGWATIKYKP
jgi:glucosylceramidase